MKLSSLRPAFVLASSAALVAGLVTAVTTSPAAAAGESYVALGDSYASGTGIRDYLDDGTSCLRSALAYPSLIAAARGYDLNFRACSGATIPDVSASQLDALGAETTYVSVSVGGNDAGFADVLTTCALPAWASNCHGAIDTAQSYIDTVLPASLGSLYDAIRARAPQARVTVVGYPRIFMGTDCNALTWFSPDEQERLNQTADRLNGRLSASAAAAGFSFANPTSAFIGHAVCDNPEWINGLSYPIVESYHPNAAGHRDGYTPIVSPSLTGAQLAVSSISEEAALEAAPAQAARQREYADADRSIEPKRFVAPDLDSHAVRAAARRAGVDLSDRRSIDRADRRFAQRQAERQAANR